jgi:hypothetical protein
MTDWRFNDGGYVTPESIEGYKAFVYIIIDNKTGKSYIGKKLLNSTNRVKVKGRKNRKVKITESNWRKYWGSNKELVEDVAKLGEGRFSRIIIKLCKNKGEASYWECRTQFAYDVLLHQDRFYNRHIMCHVHASHLPKQ